MTNPNTIHATTVAKLQQQIAELQAERIEIARRALEAAADECERMTMFPGGRQESFAHHGVQAAASAILAIDPQSIVGGE